jgi:hypothetical protein
MLDRRKARCRLDTDELDGETMSKAESRRGPNPSQLIDKQIAALGDWRGRMLARLRKLILEAVPDITEEWKWNTGVWTHNGLVCSACIMVPTPILPLAA